MGVSDWFRPSHPLFEPVLAVLLAGLAVLELVAQNVLHRPTQVLLAVLVALPVALRFRFPLFALGLMGIASIGEETQVHNEGQVLIPTACLLLGLYAVASRYSGWRFVAGGLIVAASTAATLLLREGVNSDLALVVLLPASGLLIGRASGVLLLETDVLNERTTKLERDRDEHTRVALEEERRRIARELHDVVGHSISVMGLQAGAVRSVLPAERVPEREALLAVERVGREAVGEMQRLIGLLRTDIDRQGPVPSLSRLDALVSDMRSAGQHLTMSAEGNLDDLPAGVDLAAYRICQEALTNALKHAPGAHVTARVSRAGGTLEIEVIDDGDVAPMAVSNGRIGHGLLGMRERAALYGGTVSAGPRPEGIGFGVTAALPVRER
jgi:signal transduction histidine kinase